MTFLIPGLKEIKRAALNQLRDEVSGAKHLLTPKAWIDLTAHLEARLFRIFHPTLSSSVSISTTNRSLLENVNSEKRQSRKISVSYLSLPEIFILLPDLREMVGLVIADWVQTQRKTLLRWERDRDCVAKLVPNEKQLRIIHITPGLSDPHGRGDTVTIFEFSKGSKLVYKPRPGDGERLWFSALKWLDSRGLTTASQLPGLCSRRRYFWMSYVNHFCCLSRKSISQFYWRWGAQAAVAQILGCADLHRQNWIASGDCPILVDAEMIGSALTDIKSPNQQSRDNLHPLLRTGLLPLSQEDGVGYYRNIAPFEGISANGEPKPFWPVYANRVHPPTNYKREIVDGFLAASNFLARPHRSAAFLKFVSRAAARRQVRVLQRATAQYYRILEDSLQPQQMQIPGQRLQFLLKRLGRDDVGLREARCVLRCCIPRFTATPQRHSDTRRFVTSPRAIRSSVRLLTARLAGR